MSKIFEDPIALTPVPKKQFIVVNPVVPKFKISQKSVKIKEELPGKNESISLEPGVSTGKMVKIQEKTIMDKLIELNQSGYRGYKDFETRQISQDPKFAQQVKMAGKVEKKTKILSETVNNYKNTYRSGYQGMVPDNSTTDKKLIAMGASMPQEIKNTKIFGSANGANGHNGINRDSLYVAKYTNMYGDGPLRP